MKIKQLLIIALMIIILTLIITKVEANETEGTEEESQIVTIEKDKQYKLTQKVSVKTLPLVFALEKDEISNENIRVIEILNDWCQIETSEKSGWIRINTLKQLIEKQDKNEIVQPEKEQDIPNDIKENVSENVSENISENIKEEENDIEITELNKTGYVKADGLNIRTEPSTSSEAIHSLSFNSKIKITGEIDGWYRIDYNNQIGYVSQKYVSDTKLPANTSRGDVDRTISTYSEPSEETTEENTREDSTSSSEGKEVVEFAKKYLGYKYVAGGSSPSTGFDCSGFTTYVFRNFGVSLNRSSKDQIKNGTAVSKSNLQPGDIVIFKNQGKTAIGHVGIYIGNGNFIHAANKKEGVVITALSSSYYSQRYVGARRVI